MDQLWTSAKHIAQSDGRKDDWAYVVDVYKSIGGMDLALVVFQDGERKEVLGELTNDALLTCNASGELGAMMKSDYSRLRKLFLKRQSSSGAVQKSFTWEGKTMKTTVYEQSQLV